MPPAGRYAEGIWENEVFIPLSIDLELTLNICTTHKQGKACVCVKEIDDLFIIYEIPHSGRFFASSGFCTWNVGRREGGGCKVEAESDQGISGILWIYGLVPVVKKERACPLLFNGFSGGKCHGVCECQLGVTWGQRCTSSPRPSWSHFSFSFHHPPPPASYSRR